MKAPWELASRARRRESRGSLRSACSTASCRRGAPYCQHPTPPAPRTLSTLSQCPPHLCVRHILLTHAGQQ